MSRRRKPGPGSLACFLAVLLSTALGPRRSCAADSANFSGARAFEDLRRLVAFGPRPSGSKALAEARRWIVLELEHSGWRVEQDSFVAPTPLGNAPMVNLIAKLPGARPEVVIIAGHYETKRFDDFKFVGANDAGSSSAFLIEMARLLARRKNRMTYWLVFFDGEEAIREWSATDGLYGSRHLVAKLTASGELSRIQALILVDMVADAQLDIHRETNSTAWLADLIFSVAGRLGVGKYFSRERQAIEDDHVPFVNAGVSAVDLIDFDYGPRNSFWHTAKDTLEHCSPQSLTIVGRVVTAALDEIERGARPH